ncbi:peroxidase 3-like [Macadamia integrifolia]|uniref:peroxidase 3-like n=1 Tax=Macadamia integrifolia TaxID=60698 RepID=UPI001C4E7531|nr:peroxidase 3-like [Macadamia integrifolia]XP_042489798.1 peroxidase 3-like [Macadamia integrifolia]
MIHSEISFKVRTMGSISCSSIIILGVLVFLGSAQAALQMNFYAKTCPKAEKIVLDFVKKHIPNAPSLVGPLLRMNFHDCFVRGCDASVLLNSTSTNQAEKSGVPNQTLRGFDFIDRIKSLLEAKCPGVVSCADIIALVGRDAVVTIGGPSWSVPTGRRDGLISNATETLTNIPAPTSNFSTLVSKFASKGLNLKDLVLLSGAHTIGNAHCNQSFAARLYNFSGTGGQDPSLDSEYAVALKAKCKTPLDNTTIFEMDPGSFRTFDLGYYKQVLKRRGLFTSDAALTTNSTTRSEIIQLAQGTLSNFYAEFAKSMEKMTKVGVKTGSSGEIRKNCAVLNS